MQQMLIALPAVMMLFLRDEAVTTFPQVFRAFGVRNFIGEIPHLNTIVEVYPHIAGLQLMGTSS